jgi:hypothetical protein
MIANKYADTEGPDLRLPTMRACLGQANHRQAGSLPEVQTAQLGHPFDGSWAAHEAEAGSCKEKEGIEVKLPLLVLSTCMLSMAADRWGWESLAGVKSVRPEIVLGSCDLARAAISARRPWDLDAVVKNKLQIGRIAVNEHAAAWLVVDVACWPVRVGGSTVGYALHFMLSVWYPATVAGPLQRLVNASTWESKEAGVCPDLPACTQVVKETVADLMDEFLSDLVKANP